MANVRYPIAVSAAWLLALAGTLALAAEPSQPTHLPKSAEVEKILGKYQTIRPATNDLAVYGLDWLPTWKAAKEKAAQEKWPILLMVVHNSYGNLYTGHC
jgi:hypothetical protein